MNSNDALLRKAVQETYPFFEIVSCQKDFLIYNEPEWMKYIRIKLSLEAMTDFILDEQIPSNVQRPRDHPFFLKISSEVNYKWGRITWIRDLGELKYIPAYDNLREVWLHDYDKDVSLEGFYSLCMLADERTLDDIEKRFRKPDILEKEGNLIGYLHGLSYFKSDKAVRLIMDLADVARSLYDAHILNEPESVRNSRDSFSEGATTPILEELVLTLTCINTRYAKKAIREIVSWFPKDIPIMRKVGDSLTDYDFKARLILPRSYGEELTGSKEVDIPF